MSIERRRAARIAVSHECRLAGPGGAATGTLRDVSSIGACVATKERVASDDDLVELTVEPEGDRPGLSVSARVMYARDRDGDVVAGVQFLDLDADRYRAVTAFIAAALEGAGGGKREHPRVHHRAQITCKTPKKARAVLQDISRGGLRAVVEGAVAVGDEITTEVTVGKLATPLVLTGRVVRVKSDEAGERHLAAIQLGDVTPDARTLLDKLLAALVTPD